MLTGFLYDFRQKFKGWFMPVEDSKSRVTIFDKTGKSAITAVVITELFSVLEELDVVRAPP